MAARRRRMPDPQAVERPWTAAYPPGVPPDYPIPTVPTTRLLDDAVRDYPTGPAIRFAGRPLTWLELADRVDRCAAVLDGAGVGVGDHVGIVLPNVPAMVVVLLATWRLGAIAVPVDPREPDVEVERVLGLARVRAVVGGADEADRLVRLDEVLAGGGHVATVLASTTTAWMPAAARVAAALRSRGGLAPLRPAALRTGVDERALPETVRSLELAMQQTAPPSQLPTVDPESTAVVLFTGGTTGRRKGVMLSHRNLVANAFQARLWLPDARAGHEVVLCAVPFSHAYGLTLGMLMSVLSAATMVLPHDPDPGALLPLIEQERPTLVPGVPALYATLLAERRAGSHDLSSIRACVSGAAPLSAQLVRDFEQQSGARLREGYGLSEAGPLTHANPIYGRTVEGAIGLPVTGTVAIVVDPDDPTTRRGPGEAGELAVHGPQVMQGYLDDPEATDAVLRDGWLLTGDIVTCDDDGVFRLVDRKRDVILTRGNHVYPREVEDVLLAHPDVVAAAVVGVPDRDGDEVVTAHVVAAEGRTLDVLDLAGHCRHRLAAWAVPTVIDVRDELPRTNLGKVLRRELREQAPV